MKHIATISIVLVTALGLFVTGCASADTGNANQVEGVVTEVTGDLANVESFVVLDADGNSHLLKPEQGLLFYGGPLSHLREHIVTAQRVVVTYEEGPDGAMIATLIEHADGDTTHETPEGDHDHSEGDHDMEGMTTTTSG